MAAKARGERVKTCKQVKGVTKNCAPQERIIDAYFVIFRDFKTIPERFGIERRDERNYAYLAKDSGLSA